MARQRLSRKSQNPQELLRKALRFETSLRETLTEYPFLFEEEYVITWEDLYALLANLKEKNPTADELLEQWAEPYQDAVYDIFDFADLRDEEEDEYNEGPEDDYDDDDPEDNDYDDFDPDEDDYEGFDPDEDDYDDFDPDEESLIEWVLDSISDAAFECSGTRHQRNFIDYDRMLKDAKTMETQGTSVGIDSDFWTDSDKLGILYYVKTSDDEALKEHNSGQELQKYRLIVEEMAAKGYPEAMHIKAYECYGGGLLYECDWEMSQDLLLQLMDMDEVDDEDKGWFANTLGYIYYYGRTNGGVPQYEEAVKYYTMGALFGVHESMYKLADLYIAGRGVPVNKGLAVKLITDVYRQSKAGFLLGDYSCKLADAALRMGNLYRDGIGVFPDAEEALGYYMIADLAIRLRMQEHEYYGDERVAGTIRKTLAEMKAECGVVPARTVRTSFPVVLLNAVEGGTLCEFKVRELKDGLKISARPLPRPELTLLGAPQVLLVFPESDVCCLRDHADQYAEGVELWMTKEPDMKSFKANRIVIGDKYRPDTISFYRDDEWMCSFRAKRFYAKF